MLSAELEYCLNEAFQKARDSRHEFLTVEHLLLAISDIPGVVDVLNACGADAPRLRKDLQDHIEETTPLLSGDTEQEVAPTLGFQRVLQRVPTCGLQHRVRVVPELFFVQTLFFVLPKIHQFRRWGRCSGRNGEAGADLGGWRALPGEWGLGLCALIMAGNYQA